MSGMHGPAGRRLATGPGSPRRHRWVVPLVAGLVLLAVTVTLTATSGRQAAGPRPGPALLLDEGFDRASIDPSLWGTCYWWGCTIDANDELEWYEASQVRVAGGHLNLVAEPGPVTTEDDGTYPYRSGMITTGPEEEDGPARFSFRYGSVEARIRVPAGKGLWSALWMLPAEGDSEPEVDILEVLGHDTTRSHHTLHPEGDGEELAKERSGPDLSGGWHVYRLDWSPGELRWFVDGTQVFLVKGEDVPDVPMYLMANLAVGGWWPGPPDEATRFPATMAVDYIRVRSLAAVAGSGR